jgi:glycosyltransferase involved in cell wall biosynthesis
MGLKVDAPIVHIPNFLPRPSPPPVVDRMRHARPYFLFAGRLERIKGAHVLVEAFRRYDAADLLVAGVGHDQPWLTELAQGASHIRFLGAVPYAELEHLIRHAIAVVVPSVGFEVFPTIVLEAYAQGTPVIGHRLGPLPAMLDGRGGLTYGTSDELLAALESLRAHRAQRDAIGKTGLATYHAHWTPERHLDSYLGLIVERQEARARDRQPA